MVSTGKLSTRLRCEPGDAAGAVAGGGMAGAPAHAHPSKATTAPGIQARFTWRSLHKKVFPAAVVH